VNTETLSGDSRQRKPLETIKRYYRVDRSEIAFIKFIFEAYDGIAGMRTSDPAKGVVALHVAPGCEEQVERILQDLKKKILIRRIETDPFESD
jgi:hypothetical protein